MLKVKNGVVFKAFPREIIAVILVLSEISFDMEKDIWITSGSEGKHSAKSLHYKDLALDIRTRDFNKAEVYRVKNMLEKELGEEYDVVIEKTHIHIEYDPN